MKTKAISVILIVALAFFLGREAFAAENYESVEEEDVSKLMLEPGEPPPIFLISPPPAPAAPVEADGDNRAWTKSEYRKEIEDTAAKYNLDPQVIYATIMTESEGDRFAFRYEPFIKDASLGLGQTLISTARSLGFSGDPKELYKPEVSIDLVGRYHRKILDTYGELTPQQLAKAYNSGSPYGWPVAGHLFRFNLWLNEKG